MNNLTNAQRQQCLIALLDDVIKKDEERTQGEWTKGWGPKGERTSFVCGDPAKEDIAHKVLLEDAAHIAIGSISQGRNARALKVTLESIQENMQSVNPLTRHRFQILLNSILDLYPDHILKRYLKP